MSVSSKPRKPPRRILALWFPRLPTDRLQRREKTAVAAPPLVIVAKVKNAMALQAVDRQATALGLRAGQPLANARAMLPALEVVPADETADAQVLERIANWCDRFTPHIALDGRHGLLLDVTGASHLFGGEPALLHRIRASLEAQGFAVRGAIAATAAAARALACYRDDVVIEPGCEAEAITPLPVEALGLDPAISHAFRRAGLKTVGQVASRQRSEITARFGAAILSALDEILGQGGQPISPRLPRAEYCHEQALAEPIATDDLIIATLKSLSTALSGRMQENGMWARRLEATFFRTDGALRNISITLGMATRDPDIILRLFREKLDALADPLDPGFGFDLVRLSATQVECFKPEATGLDSDLAAKKEIGFLVDRLAARFGSNRILSFQPNDTHIPEKSFSAVPAQTAPPSKRGWKKLPQTGAAPRRPLRMFARPEPINLATIARLNWRRAIIRHEGPERIAMEWWRHEEAQSCRDYFRIEDEEGRRYWLYRSRADAQWFLHGLFS